MILEVSIGKSKIYIEERDTTTNFLKEGQRENILHVINKLKVILLFHIYIYILGISFSRTSHFSFSQMVRLYQEIQLEKVVTKLSRTLTHWQIVQGGSCILMFSDTALSPSLSSGDLFCFSSKYLQNGRVGTSREATQTRLRMLSVSQS